MHEERRSVRGRFPKRRASLVLYGFIAVVAFFLLTEHRAHLFGLLPYLLLLICPLLHLFMHGGHGKNNGAGSGGAESMEGHRHNAERGGT